MLNPVNRPELFYQLRLFYNETLGCHVKVEEKRERTVLSMGGLERREWWEERITVDQRVF